MEEDLACRWDTRAAQVTGVRAYLQVTRPVGAAGIRNAQRESHTRAQARVLTVIADASGCVGRKAVGKREGAGSRWSGQSEGIASMHRADRRVSLKDRKLDLAGGYRQPTVMGRERGDDCGGGHFRNRRAGAFHGAAVRDANRMTTHHAHRH